MSRNYTFEIQELADMTTANARGSATGVAYALEPRVWSREIIDAAKKRQQFVQFAKQVDVAKGNKDIVIPRRTNYIGSGATTSGFGGRVVPGTAVPYTTINTVDGQVLAPIEHNAGVAVTYDTIRTNLVDYVSEAKDQLTYFAGDDVDRRVSQALVSGSIQSTSSVAGLSTIYGGDATQAAELTTGDTISVDMVSEGKRKLQSTVQKYWVAGTGEANSSATKNPWMNTSATPFVLGLAPEQEEVFLRDPQFVNAAEYGSDKIIHNGEIGDYLGIKVFVSNNTVAVANGGTAHDGTAAGAAMHTCPLFVSQKAVAIAYGLKPRLHIFDYPRELEKDIVLEFAYDTASVQRDAIVAIDVTDD